MTEAKLEVETEWIEGKGLTQRKVRGEFQSKALGPEGEEQRWWYRKPEDRGTFRSRDQMGMQKVGVMG